MEQKSKFVGVVFTGMVCAALVLVAFANGGKQVSAQHRARALSAAGAEESSTSVHFAVIGDFGERGKAEEAVATLVAQWDPEFIITLGDNNYPDGESSTMDRNVGELYHDYIYPYLGPFATPTPDATPGPAENRFWPILGNHDWHALSVNNGVVTGPYFDYFTLPGNERYYDLVKGPVHFFMLDSDSHEPDGIKQTSIQANWLQQQLSASTAPWKLVLSHYAPYSSSTHGSTLNLQWPYKEWGADIVIAGHDHVYERLEEDGFPYVVNGLGGASRYTFKTPVAGSLVRYASSPGAMLVDADEQSITLQMVITSGVTIDQIVLTKSSVTPTAPTPTIPESTPNTLFLPLIDSGNVTN